VAKGIKESEPAQACEISKKARDQRIKRNKIRKLGIHRSLVDAVRKNSKKR